ncbi:hypothetical protein [Streptomyces sp. ME18-1-4]|uniref:hypothetical protein n=1 Tax=Streptomyces sp. ME18-1-4 TaxID=3028685 RepID=UPI0029CAABAE|nr:hypothetical protein [Streptomyces sp. ME18-1-4]
MKLTYHPTDAEPNADCRRVATSGATAPPGQAIFASHGGLVLVEELPDPPAHDAARFGALPDVMPLAVQHAPDIPYAAATVHRAAPGDRRAGGDGGGLPDGEVAEQRGRT